MINSFTYEYHFLSNFFLCPITYMGLYYRSAEHAYQASKTLNESERRSIMNARFAVNAKSLGQKATLRDDWDEVKLKIMHGIVRNKFEQNPHLRRQLLATGTQELAEGNWWHDTYWGVCNGEGENHLGHILMNIREELQ